MRNLKNFVKCKKNRILLTVFVVIIMSYMIGKWFNSLVYENRFLQANVLEQEQAQESAQAQESVQEEVQPWHWIKVSGGTFQELEPPQEGQGA